MSEQIAIARKAGLLVVGDRGTLVMDNTPLVLGVQYIDPVTRNGVLDPTMNANPVFRGLPAPSLRWPENGPSIDHFPSKVDLQWSTVAGAAGYVVQVVILPIGATETSYSSIDKGLMYIQRTTKQTAFAFELDRVQPGRWRVWAVDARGTEGLKSAWSTFEFTQ
ncbi:MAG: hypothetical protein WA765_06485 [Candidatus Acidiferrum sp.]